MRQRCGDCTPITNTGQLSRGTYDVCKLTGERAASQMSLTHPLKALGTRESEESHRNTFTDSGPA